MKTKLAKWSLIRANAGTFFARYKLDFWSWFREPLDVITFLSFLSALWLKRTETVVTPPGLTEATNKATQ